MDGLMGARFSTLESQDCQLWTLTVCRRFLHMLVHYASFSMRSEVLHKRFPGPYDGSETCLGLNPELQSSEFFPLCCPVSNKYILKNGPVGRVLAEHVLSPGFQSRHRTNQARGHVCTPCTWEGKAGRTEEAQVTLSYIINK